MRGFELTPDQIKTIKNLWKTKSKRVTVYREIADIVGCATISVERIVKDYEKYYAKTI